MRIRFALVLALAPAFACGGSGPGTGDDQVTPDAPDVGPTNGFRLQSPDITIQPGEETTRCWYFKTPNTASLAIHHWSSTMTPGSHHMIMFMTGTDQTPSVNPTLNDCGGVGGGTSIPVWTYAAQTPTADLTLPADDGTGKALAQDIPAGAFGYFQMHYLNATDQPIAAHVTLDAEALDPGTAHTTTAAYVTFNGNISIPPGAGVGSTPPTVASQTCQTPAGVKFWLMSTHAHKQAIKTEVKDGGTSMFTSTDWEHPGAAMFMTPPEFYSYANNQLTYACTYKNETNPPRTIHTGNSAATDEMCMATGYFFPATGPKFCYNNIVIN